jgi:hypothetical protein
MAKRRTKKQKLKAQAKPKAITRKVRFAPTIDKETGFFYQDLRHSLLVIGFILLLEFGIWYLLSQ